MATEQTPGGIVRYRQRIIDDAVSTFAGTDIFSSPGRPEDVVRAVCEGLLDLLMEPEKYRDPHVVRRYAEWVYNLIRKQSLKTDTTVGFLDAFENIVTRYLDNREDAQVDAFFELCRDIVERKHKELARGPSQPCHGVSR